MTPRWNKPNALAALRKRINGGIDLLWFGNLKKADAAVFSLWGGAPPFPVELTATARL